MATMELYHLTRATIERMHHTIWCTKKVLVEVHRHFSHLSVMTVAEFATTLDEKEKWRVRMFEKHKDEIIPGGPPEKLGSNLLFKSIKYASSWKDPDGLVEFVHHERTDLEAEPTLSNDAMLEKLEKVKQALLTVIQKVEKEKEIQLRKLTVDVRKVFPVTLSDEFPDVHKVSAKHSTHRLFVMLFKQLNQLKGKSVGEYGKGLGINALASFTPNERRLLEKETPPEKMPVRLLFKLLQKFCGLERRQSASWHSKSDSLEYLITCLKERHQEISSKSVIIDYDWSHTLLQLFEQVLDMVAATNKAKVNIMEEMPEEPANLNESFLCNVADSQLKDECSTQREESPSFVTAFPSTGLSSQGNVSPNELNITCLYYALCPGGPAVRVMIIVFHEFSGDLQKVISMKSKATLAKDDLHKLESGMPLEELDVTLLAKILRFGCTNLNELLKDLLYDLKRLRNQFSHEKIFMTENDLKQKMRELECLLKQILEETEVQTGKNLHHEIVEIEKELHRLSKPPVNPDDIKQYQEKVMELKKQVCYDTVHKCRLELVEKYNQDSAKNAFPETWRCLPDHTSFTIEKVFVEPVIDYSSSGLRKKCVQSLLDVGRYTPNKVILHGVAGTGKTSICQYLSYTWANSSGAIGLLLLIKCKTVKQESLLQFLMSFLPNSLRKVAKDDILDIMQNLRIMFIIDAYDEATPEAKELVKDILHTLPRSAMIITTKDHLVPKLEHEVLLATGSNCMFLKVLGFDEEKQREYVLKYFQIASADSGKAVEMLKYLESLQDHLATRNLTSLPLSLSLLAILWNDDANNAKEANTLTRIYRKVIELTLSRFTDDSFIIREWIVAFGKIAWQNLQKKSLYLSERDVHKLRKTVSEQGPGKQVLTALLQSNTGASKLDIKEQWTFFHNSQQEFLAAEYLVEETIENSISLKEKNMSLQVLEFVAGLLAQDDQLTQERVDELTRDIAVQTPLAFEVVKRLEHDVGSESEYFRSRVHNLFQGESLCNVLNHFDPMCVQWIIENTAISVPAKLRIINSASSVIKMAPLLQTLNRNSCRPEITVTIDYLDDAHDLLYFVRSDLGFELKLHIQNSIDLHKLIGSWESDRPLHLVFPEALFCLLWWELKTSLAKKSWRGSIIFSSAVKHQEDFMCGVKQLGLEWRTDSDIDPYEVVIRTLRE